MVSLLSFFKWRVENSLRPWPEGMQRDLRKYLGLSRNRRSTRVRLDGYRNDQPYWILLPFWLMERLGGRNSLNRNKHFMDDILWGQYCLFIFIRIQDDIFDRHTDHSSLIYASDRFLLEAERIFSKYFRQDTQFWEIFLNAIEETLMAISIADYMERKPVRDYTQLLKRHGQTSTICNVAPVAVCMKAGEVSMISRVAKFSNEMMKVGAILDDLSDIEEDIDRGRFNYAASILFNGGQVSKPTRKHIVSRINRNILFGDGLTKLFSEIYHHLKIAEKTFKPIMVPAASAYLKFYLRSIRITEDRIHRQRVKWIFNG